MSVVLRSFYAAFLVCIPLLAQTPLTSDKYAQEVAELQNRDRKLREQIAQEQAVILDLKKSIASSQQRIKEIRQKKLSILGVTAEDVAAASQAINLLHRNLTELVNLSDHQFMQDSARLSTFRIHFENLYSNRAAKMPDLADRITKLSQLIIQCEKRLSQLMVAEQNKAPAESVAEKIDRKNSMRGVDSYTVKNIRDEPESLFSIAQQIYGDPLQWRRIYEANKATIDVNFKSYVKNKKSPVYSDPSDLIFPGQVLVIPR